MASEHGDVALPSDEEETVFPDIDHAAAANAVYEGEADEEFVAHAQQMSHKRAKRRWSYLVPRQLLWLPLLRDYRLPLTYTVRVLVRVSLQHWMPL